MATSSCGDALSEIANNDCSYIDYGQQYVWIAIQSMKGTSPFANNTALATAATWQTALDASGANKVFVIPNLAATNKPDPTLEQLTGNDTPFGTDQITDMVHQITVRCQYLTNADNIALNKLLKSGNLRMWLMDNKYYLEGGPSGITNVRINPNSMGRPGFGNGAVGRTLSISYRYMGQPEIYDTPVPAVFAVRSTASTSTTTTSA